jgi:YesN/AraC family two-component response regulator
MQELSKSIAIQMYNDPVLSGLLFIPFTDPVEIYNSLASFSKYRNLIPYVHSVYIYNSKNNAFYISSPARAGMIQEWESFFDKEIISLIAEPENINSVKPIPRIINEPGVLANREEKSNVYTFIYNMSGVKNFEYPGTVIINISEDWVRNIIDSLDINPLIKTLIIDSNDRLLISDPERELLTNAGIYDYIKDSLDKADKSGYSIITKDNIKSFLVYSVIDIFNWIFIKIIPYKNITEEINEIRKTLITIAVIILLIGTVISYIMARRLYKPIDNILLKLNFLEEKQKSDKLLVKNVNFRRLLTQSVLLSEYELNRFIDELNIGLKKDDIYSLVLFEIDRYNNFVNSFSGKERNLIKLGMIESISGIINAKYLNEGMDTGTSQLVFILNIEDEDTEKYDRTIGEMIIKIQKEINRNFQVTLSAVICAPNIRKEEISSVYERLTNLIHHKYIHGCNSMINEKNMETVTGNLFTYPYKKEENLIRAVNSGKRDAAIMEYNEIIKYARTFGYNALITTRNSLAYSVNKEINKLKKNYPLKFSFNFTNFFKELNSAETLDDSNKLFYDLIDKLLSFIIKRNSSRNYEFITSIVQKIETDYKDVRFSISYFADIYKISAAYLGRLFKKYTGKSMPDYINEVRIKKSEEYIINTDFSMLEIMELSGFTNKTHFYSMFKKYNGVTPRDFRQKG